MNTNPLLNEVELPFGAIDFTLIKEEHYLPALDKAIELAEARLERIKAEENPDFYNTIEALEFCSDEFNHVNAVFHNINSSNTNDQIQEIAQSFGPKSSQFTSKISLDSKLFENIKTVYNKKDQLDLNPEQLKLLVETYESFTREGALLPDNKKNQLKSINEKLSKLSIDFSQNLLAATNSFEMNLTDEKDVSGLPESALEAAQELAQSKKQTGWTFNLQYPSYIPFMQYADNREAREKLWRAFASRSVNGEHSNQENVLKLIKLRHEKASILGLNNYAEYILQKRMAETPETVFNFIDKIFKASKPAAEKELKELVDYVKTQGGPSELKAWDLTYYSEKLKKHKFSFDEEEIRTYFQLESVIDGAFLHAEKLYGINFIEKTSEYPTYHSDVRVYEVFNKKDDQFIGLFYADFFPRESKRSGAWMSQFKSQGFSKGKVQRPHIKIVCNFTKPTATKPSLLTVDEVTTLFHEFGHALHGLLSQCHYASLSGTSVYWDFVELPSQIMENWALEKEGLDLFAKHYQTGETIPQNLIDKIKSNAKFQSGLASLRQVRFATLDMNWHTTEPENIKDVIEFENQACAHTDILPRPEGVNNSCAFGHIFAGGYAAGYYSYKWAEVLDADAFEYFKEEGIFNQKVASDFREHILERGATEHPMELYKKFRGRTPDPDALLRRDGLL